MSLNLRRVLSRIQDNDDFTGALTDGLALVWNNAASAFNLSDFFARRTGGGDEAFNDIGNSGASFDVDLDDGNVQEVTLTADCTMTFSNPAASGRVSGFTLVIKQDGTGGWTPTFPASVLWAGGSAPTASSGINAVDIFIFYTYDAGATWYGFTSGQDFS